jgi:hypothetical protein
LEQPYDVTGWTLPLQMGVQYFAGEQEILDLVADTLIAFKLSAAQLAAGQFALANVPREKAEYFVVSPNSLDAYRLANRLLKNNQPVFWNRDKAVEKNFAPGQLLISAAQTNLEELARAAQSLSVNIATVAGAGNANAWRLKWPRVAIYRSYAPTADEGWTRFVLDEYEFDYKTLEDGDLRRGEFVSQFDAIIFPDQTDSTILLGRRSDDDDNKFPPEFTGGIGTVGLANVRHFVEQGGTLLAFDSATRLFIRQWSLPVVNELENVKSNEFSAPGSLLRGIVDPNHPIAFGTPRETTLFFGNSAAFTVRDGKTIVKYPLQNPLLSGWLQGEAKIQGQAALVESPLGRGRVILFGFRPQHRGQTYATFKLEFNSLWYAAAENVNLGKASIAE